MLSWEVKEKGALQDRKQRSDARRLLQDGWQCRSTRLPQEGGTSQAAGRERTEPLGAVWAVELDRGAGHLLVALHGIGTIC